MTSSVIPSTIASLGMEFRSKSPGGRDLTISHLFATLTKIQKANPGFFALLFVLGLFSIEAHAIEKVSLALTSLLLEHPIRRNATLLTSLSF